uniref:Uncharacterized protein n=1 Tax=Nothobranchius pienaari TaxID=704102 RepID=A0A1A8PQX2_9TELE
MEAASTGFGPENRCGHGAFSSDQAGILKGISILLVWLKDIVNQFWYIFQKAQHRDMFNDMWVVVLHHVTGKHEWTRGKCDHGPLDATTSDKELMVPGSPPHEALQRIMFNRR